MITFDAARTRVDEALATLSTELKGDFKLGDDNAVLLEFEKNLPFMIRLAEDVSSTPRVIASAIVATDMKPDAEIFATLLEYNWHGLRTAGTSLAWNREAQTIAVWQALPAEKVDAAALKELLEHVIKAGLHVREEINAFLSAPPDTGKDAPLDAPGGSFLGMKVATV